MLINKFKVARNLELGAENGHNPRNEMNLKNEIQI